MSVFDERVNDAGEAVHEGVDLVVPVEHREIAHRIVEASKEAVTLGKDAYDVAREGSSRAEKFDLAERAVQTAGEQATAFGAPAPVEVAARAIAKGLDFVEDVLEARDRRRGIDEDAPRSRSTFRHAAATSLPPLELEFRLLDRPSVAFDVARLRWNEALGEPYAATLELVSDEGEVQPEDCVGASCELRVSRELEERVLYGVVRTVEERPEHDGGVLFVMEVVPAMQLLELERRSAVFEGCTAPEIVRETLEAPLQRYGRTLRFDLRRTYVQRDYCVRFRESTLEFVLRLVAEEGWTLTFVPDPVSRTEVAVIRDHTENEPEFADGEEVPFADHANAEHLVESIASLAWHRRVTTNAVSCTAYDWKGPATQHEETRVEDGPSHRDLRVALEPPRRVTIDDPLQDPRAESSTGRDEPSAKPWAMRELEALRRTRRVAEGISNLAGLTPGHRLSTGFHAHESLDRITLLVTRVAHEAEVERAVAGGPVHGASYRNRFSAIEAGARFSPAMSAKPRVHGAQLATVIGPPDEEVFTDRFGRIKVRFHWNEDAEEATRSSCWVRVAQTSAGSGFGAVFLPRVGMEVVVHFVDGDPDQPLVVGCVYNGANPLPYAMPQERTRSGWVTQSSPGGRGHHELAFDDTAGREVLSVRAQRRLNVDVKGDETRSIDHDRCTRIAGHDTSTVGGAHTLVVRGPHGPGGAQDPLAARTLVERGDYLVHAAQGT